MRRLAFPTFDIRGRFWRRSDESGQGHRVEVLLSEQSTLGVNGRAALERQLKTRWPGQGAGRPGKLAKAPGARSRYRASSQDTRSD